MVQLKGRSIPPKVSLIKMYRRKVSCKYRGVVNSGHIQKSEWIIREMNTSVVHAEERNIN